MKRPGRILIIAVTIIGLVGCASQPQTNIERNCCDWHPIIDNGDDPNIGNIQKDREECEKIACDAVVSEGAVLAHNASQQLPRPKKYIRHYVSCMADKEHKVINISLEDFKP